MALKVSDQDKAEFITPHDIYCYTAVDGVFWHTKHVHYTGLDLIMELTLH
jgi:hypothetical protein